MGELATRYGQAIEIVSSSLAILTKSGGFVFESRAEHHIWPISQAESIYYSMCMLLNVSERLVQQKILDITVNYTTKKRVLFSVFNHKTKYRKDGLYAT